MNRTAKTTGDDFFETHRACVLTLRNAQEWPLLRERLDLRLTELIKSTYGDIFPPKVFLAQSNAPRLGSILKMRAGVGLTRAGAGRQTVVRDVHAGTVGRRGLRATNCWAGDPAQPSGKAPARTLATAATEAHVTPSDVF